MKKIVLLIFIFSPLSTWALSLLPNNSYLRYKDNLKEVKILQEILNTDTETLVADEGPGSPGNENWFYGVKTEEAVNRFQEKYNLVISGKVDRETLKKLNEISTNFTAPKKNINPPIAISQTEKNKLKTELKNAIKKKEVEKLNTETEDSRKNTSLIDSLVNRYTGFFTNATKTNSINSEQTTTEANPYLHNNNSAQQIPTQQQNTQGDTSQANNFGSPGSPGSPGGVGGFFGGQNFGSNSGNNIFGSNLNNLPLGPSGPGQVNNIGTLGGTIPDGNGSCGGSGSGNPRLLCQGNATKYAHGAMSDGCVADGGDQQNNQRAASGQILSRMGVRAIPAVALPPVVHRRVGWGTAVEVKDLSNGNCKAFPLLDSGPANFVLDRGTVIDLTGSAFDILQGKTPCASVSGRVSSFPGSMKVQYAVNVSGKKLQPGEVADCSMLGGKIN